MWNIILSNTDNENIIHSQNQPQKSGDYLCTCVKFKNIMNASDNEIRYLEILHYDAGTQSWNDKGNKSGLSHNILAWRDDIEVCEFNDYDFKSGYFFAK